MSAPSLFRLGRVIGDSGLCIIPFLTACTAAPAQNIAGSFFPSWLLCAAGGVIGAVATRAALGATGIGTGVPFPLLTYPAIAGSITLVLWLVLFGH
ncbi:YtcA family lipoprotein [Komagataeibacter swingsii]|uniref:Uncharacterized protein YtcA n=1 Tax=Komagataeibacter swingsii TaxID=215220 RepID=A0A850P422_9PROT|nr:hypothetical protein [Komagataeibacter swingsii]